MQYTQDDIVVMEGLEAVRRRPGMYFGGGAEAQTHLLWELVNNALDEHLAGHATSIDVALQRDGTWTVSDDGRGIALDQDGYVDRVFCEMHSSATYDDHAPHVHLGKFGVGLAAASAVCELFVVHASRASGSYEVVFRRGNIVSKLERLGACIHRGTTIHFRPDRTVFSEAPNLKSIEKRIIEVAYLNPTLQLIFMGRNISQPGGLKALARSHARGVVSDALWVQGRAQHVDVQLALLWGEGKPVSQMFANQCELTKEGTPLATIRRVLASNPPTVIVGSLMLQAPHYLGRTKEQLQSEAAGKAVESLLQAALSERESGDS